MANITRIKAGDPHKKREDDEPKQKKPKNTKPAATRPAPNTNKSVKKPETKETSRSKQQKPAKKPFFLIRPFMAFGRYVKASWHELRQVRWPSRKYTWKMTVAMLVYCLIFLVIIVLLDLLFSFIFNNLLG